MNATSKSVRRKPFQWDSNKLFKMQMNPSKITHFPRLAREFSSEVLLLISL